MRAAPIDRIRGALGAAALSALLGYALITGLGTRAAPPPDEALKLFELPDAPASPPRQQPKPRRAHSERPQGAPSAPNLRSRASEIVVPRPPLPQITEPKLVAAPVPGIGSAATTGAARELGPGSGSAGTGAGTGAGGSGEGDGGGNETPPRLLRGRLKDSDYPRTAAETGIGGTVSVRYLVETNGRVTDCIVTRSSGSPELDATTCRLIEQRFRFSPSRDERGKPVPAIIVENHTWVIENVPPEAPSPNDRP